MQYWFVFKWSNHLDQSRCTHLPTSLLLQLGMCWPSLIHQVLTWKLVPLASKKHLLFQLQGRTWQVLTSTRAVAARSQWGQIAWMTKRRNPFLNWISWCTSDQLSRVVRKMDDCLVLHVNLPSAITHWCDSIQCLAGAPALEDACDHSYVKMCLHIIFQKFHGCCNTVEHGFGAHTVALSIELMP